MPNHAVSTPSPIRALERKHQVVAACLLCASQTNGSKASMSSTAASALAPEEGSRRCHLAWLLRSDQNQPAGKPNQYGGPDPTLKPPGLDHRPTEDAHAAAKIEGGRRDWQGETESTGKHVALRRRYRQDDAPLSSELSWSG